jgi:hAT family C-terminal dimerisation region
MSAECERVFSSAKKMITPDRNGLNDDIVEACECLKYWWDNSLVLYNKPTDNELWQEVEAEVEREEQTMYD